MATFVYDSERGEMVDKDTRQPMLTAEERAGPVPTPRVFGDYEGYASPIDGKWVEGRRARQYDMESNGCVDANDFSTPKGLKNEKFAKKHNLEHLLGK